MPILEIFGFAAVAVLTGALREVGKKALNGPAASLYARLEKKWRGLPPSAVEMAVARCVEQAAQDVIREQEGGELLKSHWLSDQLEAPELARDVTQALLFRGQPDFVRLWQAYFREGEALASGAPRPDLDGFQITLAAFFDAVESRVLADPEVGPVVRDARQLASILSLDERARLLNEAVGEANRHLGAIARSSQEAAEGVGALVGEVRQVKEILGRTKPGEATLDELTDEEEQYLRLLRKECNRLPLAEVGRDEKEKPASLANVYVDLATTQAPTWELVFARIKVPKKQRPDLLRELSRSAEGSPARSGQHALALDLDALATWGALEARGGGIPEPLKPWVEGEAAAQQAFAPVTALEMLGRQAQFVLLGDPGSGKSTFVNYLAGTFAGAWLGNLPTWGELLQGSFEAPCFPARILLRAWNTTLDSIEEEGLELAHRAFQELAPAVPLERWKKRFGHPRTLVLFDGLDEVPGLDQEAEGEARKQDRRLRILTAVAAFATAHPQCRVLVTCRERPYVGPYRLTGFPACLLAPLDKPRIDRFVYRWYSEMVQATKLPADKADQCRDDLLAALEWRSDLREMAGTPLLLTMLVRVNARTGLPQGRSVLYRECIEQLLWELEKVKSDEGEVENLDQLLRTPMGQIDRGQVERVLWDLAFEVHGGSRERVADFAVAELRTRLAGLYPTKSGKAWEWAEEMVALMRRRGGLLNPTDRGVLTLPHRSFQEYLAARGLLCRHGWREEAGRLAASDTWFEVLQLAAGHLFKETDYWSLLDLLRVILGARATLSKAGGGVRRILLAGKVSVEQVARVADLPSRGMRQGLLKRAMAGLERAMQHAQLTAAQRLEAGLLLSDLHQLLGTSPETLGLEDLVEIPAGKHDERFKIARYPVTNLQFARFIEAGGYREDSEWWQRHPEAKKEILNFEQKYGAGKWPTEPRLWRDASFNRALQPVVGVSWYEALAYCEWLTDLWRSTRHIEADEEIRLASVAQWQRAAGGEESRQFPWLEPFDRSYANTKESGLGQPTPVTMYSQGETPEGVWDLAGNVWEWTAEPHQEYAGAKVLVGGAWWNDEKGVGSAARSRDHPDVRGYFLGFRVVVVPSSRRRSDF